MLHLYEQQYSLNSFDILRSLRHDRSTIDQDIWFSSALGINCHLVSCTYERSRNINDLPESKISFANEAQFLCISKKSFEFISETIFIQKQQIVDISCFRSNFILEGNLLAPFQEENWLRKSLQIGDQFFYITEVSFARIIKEM